MYRSKHSLLICSIILILLVNITACRSAGPFAEGNYISKGTNTSSPAVTEAADIPTLSVPTCITRIKDNYYIVDCYHSRVIYNDNLTDPISDFKTLIDEESTGFKLGHTIAYDDTVMLLDDTENNRVFAFDNTGEVPVLTTVFDNIGNKPHFIVYDDATDSFYCWSSLSGEMYIFRHPKKDATVYLTDVITIDKLTSSYVRSFTISDGKLYFVSGLPAAESCTTPPQILIYDLKSFEELQTINVPENIAGMAQLQRIGDYWYITVSTDLYGNQDYADIYIASSLEDIEKGALTSIYVEYFAGGGTPYYIGCIDGKWYLTEHRLPAHAIWSFDTDESGMITASQAIY
ncbi:hypothetical protein [Butyrivibrio sp. MC2013]|uniref:hypothetical protein n=1 Tax=Butyrivibrio sp. MC2013 TaxID=1280686 RepID=UPI000683EC8B|nr:hypothetical protein [Butyrivibrio sp. MC2013]